MTSLLHNDIITLRAMEPQDVDLLYEWENDTDLWTVSNTCLLYTSPSPRDS